MRILDAHLRNALLGLSLVVALALTGISGFVTLVEELDDLGQGNYGLAEVGLVTLLKMPELLYNMFPLIVLLGAILGLGGLAAGGELVVMQAAGISVRRLAWSAGKAGLLLGLLVLLLGEFLVPFSQRTADEISSRARFGADRSISRSVWLRQGEEYIRIGALEDARTISGLQVLSLDPRSHQLVRSMSMGQATYVDGQWQARDVRVTDIDRDAVVVRNLDQADWNVRLDPELLQLFVLKSEGLSLRGLYQYIRYLRDNGLDATAPEYALWRKLAAPLTVLVMVFLAVPFVLGPLRDTGAGERLFIGVMIGIGFYVLNEVMGSLGQVYHWPAALAALAPTGALGVLAIWRLGHVAAR